MILAARFTHTPISEFMGMTIREFYRVFVVIVDTMRKLNGKGE